MKLRSRILSGYFIIISLFGALTAANLVYLNHTRSRINIIVERKLRAEKSFQEARSIVMDLQAGIWDIMILSPEKRTSFRAAMDFNANLFYDSMYLLSEEIPENRSRFQELRRLFMSYYQLGTAVLELPDIQSFERKRDTVAMFKSNKEKLLLMMSDIMMESQSELERELRNLNLVSRIATTIASIAGILLVIFSVIVSITHSSRIIRPFSIIVDVMRRFESGNLTAEIPPFSDEETGALAYAFNRMARRIRENIIRREELLNELEVKNQTLYHEIAEKESARAALASSEEKLTTIIESIPVALAVTDYSDMPVFYNHIFREKFNPDESINAGFTAFIASLTPDSAAGRGINHAWEDFARRQAGYTFRSHEFHTSGIDGSLLDLEIHAARIAEGIVVLIHDLTEKHRMERELADEKEKLAVTLRSIGDAVISTDIEGRIVFMNPIAEELTGWKAEEARGRPVGSVFRIINEYTRSSVESPVDRVLNSGGIEALANHTLLIARDGREIAVADSAAPIRDSSSVMMGVVLVFRDVTEKRKYEDEIQKKQRLESLGVLAGGIAHDFNNILTAILGNINLARMMQDIPPAIEKYLKEAEKASVRAGLLTQQLLTFAKGGTPVRTRGDIRALIEDSLSFLLRGANITYTIECPDELLPITFDEGQISQVFHNLIINARQAMNNTGVISVRLENSHEAGFDYVRILFTDNGPGIPAETIKHVFDPYFTTKEEGHGLGLTTVYSIIMKHEGLINIESREGEGTTFDIRLPITHEAPTPEAEIRIPRQILHEGMALIMDDEESVRDVGGSILEKLGYRAQRAANSTEALRAVSEAKSRGESFRFVILDLTIPGDIGGLRSLEKIREMDPGCPAIVSSGYSNDPVLANYRTYGFNGMIIKPYRLETVKEVIESVLS